ncbi:MAG TPA: O-antigen ligase family protein [Longimicrobiales bacterium]|nr:O-antigen ligase family protein [Longimicrobiales bacterium]
MTAPRFALTALQVGALAVVAMAVTFREYELDRFYVPKELVLHVAALLAGVALLRWRGGDALRPTGAAGWLLVAFTLASAVSAVFAPNGWLAFRALAVTVSGLVVFLAARGVAGAGLQRPLLAALALAVVAGTATALLQAYGVRWDIFSVNRAPGGTLGNRNSIAHLAALGMPLVLVVAVRARRWWGYLPGALGVALVAAALVLTRSRAAWLGMAAVLALLAVSLVAAPALRRHRRTGLRIAGIMLLCGGGVAGVLIAPNTLQWRSDSPYLDSLRGVADYREGSGAGRLVQYRQSLGMARTTPVLGVGPGNWPVVYPEHAAQGDPSMSGGTPGTTSNPWPSSDWVAYVSERGFPAALLLVAAILALAGGALRRLRHAAATEDALAAAALLGVLAGAIVTGLFDAVLLLAHPTFIVWAAAGALSARTTSATDDIAEDAVAGSALGAGFREVTYAGGHGHAREDVLPDDGADPAVAVAADASGGGARRAAGRAVVTALLLVTAVGAVRSSAQVYSMRAFSKATDTATLQRAARLDPGNYRLRLRLARPGSGLSRADRCAHADAAHALFPRAAESRTLSRGCR